MRCDAHKGCAWPAVQPVTISGKMHGACALYLRYYVPDAPAILASRNVMPEARSGQFAAANRAPRDKEPTRFCARCRRALRSDNLLGLCADCGLMYRANRADGTFVAECRARGVAPTIYEWMGWRERHGHDAREEKDAVSCLVCERPPARAGMTGGLNRRRTHRYSGLLCCQHETAFSKSQRGFSVAEWAAQFHHRLRGLETSAHIALRTNFSEHKKHLGGFALPGRDPKEVLRELHAFLCQPLRSELAEVSGASFRLDVHQAAFGAIREGRSRYVGGWTVKGIDAQSLLAALKRHYGISR